jgi:hypothetical protein
MHFAVLGINTALRREGIVRTERVEGNVTLTYLSPNEVATLQQQYLDEAESIARPYLLTDGTINGFSSLTSDDCAEAATRARRCC